MLAEPGGQSLQPSVSDRVTPVGFLLAADSLTIPNECDLADHCYPVVVRIVA